MGTQTKEKKETMDETTLQDFTIDTKRDILDYINDSPSLVKLGEKEYKVKGMRYYSVYRIAKLVLEMRANDASLDSDNKVLSALCTDLDAMSEIMAIILVNHLFTPQGIGSYEEGMERNDRLVREMKMVVMNNTYDETQWAAIIIGAIKSIDLSAFFLLKKSVSMLTDSLVMRKRMSVETASRFMEAQSLGMQATSSEPSHNTP